MGRRVVLRERLSQPQSLTGVDWGNPITRGLIALVDGVSRRDLMQTALPTSYNGAQLGASSGLAMGYETGQFASFAFANRSRIANQLSVFSFTDYTASGTPNSFLFGDTEAAGVGYNFGLYSNGVQWLSFVKTGGSGASASGGTFGQRRRFAHSFTYDGANIRQYLDGVAAGVTAKTGNVDTGAFGLNINRWNASSPHAGRFFVGAVWNRALTPAEIVSLSANPWQLFAPQSQAINLAATVSVYRPGSDITVNGWTSTPSGTLASCIDDPTLDRADFITSPDLSSPATLAWNSPLPAGNWSVSVDGVRVGTAGQVRVVCLDAGGTSVGNTSWQVLTGTDTTYTLPVTTTATSTQFRIEVQ
jgi:hypothetical protein